MISLAACGPVHDGAANADACTSTPDATGAADVSIDPGTPTVDPARPPPRPSVASTETPKVDRWLVVHTIRLGLTDHVGTPDNSAWKQLGFDLDDRQTSVADSEANGNTACRQIGGAATEVLADGLHGIDNNFGSMIMSVVESLESDAEDSVNTAIERGGSTLLLHLEGVGPLNDPHVAGALYAVRGVSKVPPFSPARWDGTDVWPVEASSLTDGATIGSPALHFDDGYVANGVWVSGDAPQATTISLDLSLGATAFPIRFSFIQLSVGIEGFNGTIAGVMSADDIGHMVTPFASSVGACPCDSRYQSILDTMTEGLDLSLHGDGFRSPSSICDGMSVGLGFTATTAAPPTKVIPDDTSVPTCIPSPGFF